MAGILTKKALSFALLDLLKKKHITRISISELTSVCEINRQTFYYHFSDIYELLEWTLEEELKNYRKENSNISYMETVALLRKLILERRELYINAYDSRNQIYYERFLIRQIYPAIKGYILKNPLSEGITKDRIDFIARSFAKIIVGLFIDWIAGGAKEEDLGDWDYVRLLLDEEDTNAILKRFKENQTL